MDVSVQQAFEMHELRGDRNSICSSVKTGITTVMCFYTAELGDMSNVGLLADGDIDGWLVKTGVRTVMRENVEHDGTGDVPEDIC